MKIGIISEFSKATVNYGNILQTYALNKYLRTSYPMHQVETLYFSNEYKANYTSYIGVILRKLKLLLGNLRKSMPIEECSPEFLSERKKLFNAFANTNIQLCSKPMNWDLLKKSDYDLFIVGSDIVWIQIHFNINRIKFLNFINKKNAKKASYSASFGQDWIPKENRKWIRKYLNEFIKISVRESSSVKLLKSIGVCNVVHTLDPTLLLNANEWKDLEFKPKNVPDTPFAFVYLLGEDLKQQESIINLCKREELTIISIPFANAIECNLNEFYGDVRLSRCAPEEWIWLIHHADLVITDSFHGTVFSTIFKRKFLAIKRYCKKDINNRIEDYLRIIQQEDKIVNLSDINNLSDIIWDYENISSLLLKYKLSSIEYIDDIIRIANGDNS